MVKTNIKTPTTHVIFGNDNYNDYDFPQKFNSLIYALEWVKDTAGGEEPTFEDFVNERDIEIMEVKAVLSLVAETKVTIKIDGKVISL